LGASSNNSTILAQFEDTWKGGMKTYIHEFMYPIVQELHRILKPTGSFYLHCDPTAQAYLQVEILDKIFGISNFRNEIVWNYRKWSIRQKQFASNHDIIFFYTKTREAIFNSQFIELSEGTLKRWKGKKQQAKFDESGKRSANNLNEESKGSPMPDCWDISVINPQAKERTGYPTQKPEKLLERIILASSNEGDTVLDCFNGSGTTIVVADKFKRNWIGIDQSPVSIAVTRSRLALNQDLFHTSNYSTITAKWDYEVLRKMDDFEFEKLMVTKITGTPSKNTKGGDMGIDGIVNSKTVISVKRSDGIGRNVVDNLQTATKRHRRDHKNLDNAKDNYIIKIQKGEINLSDYDAVVVAFSFGKGTYSEVVDMKIQDNFNILLLTVEDILPVAKPPKVEIITEDKTATDGYWSFLATTKSQVENYSWIIKDNKNNEIIATESLSIEPVFNKAITKKGDYTITCEVVDDNGLSGLDEVIICIK
jgi:DNA modification methylase